MVVGYWLLITAGTGICVVSYMDFRVQRAQDEIGEYLHQIDEQCVGMVLAAASAQSAPEPVTRLEMAPETVARKSDLAPLSAQINELEDYMRRRFSVTLKELRCTLRRCGESVE